MASAEDIYRVTLQELSAEGNQKAQLALSMAIKVGGTDSATLKSVVIREIKQANEYLQQALGENDMKWTRATDRRINDAQGRLMVAIEHMTK